VNYPELDHKKERDDTGGPGQPGPQVHFSDRPGSEAI
jgi:hypothetical protein